MVKMDDLRQRGGGTNGKESKREVLRMEARQMRWKRTRITLE